MHIIDTLRAELARSQGMASLAAVPFDPILFLSEDGKPWTLGMVLSMWRYVFSESRREICKRGIPF